LVEAAIALRPKLLLRGLELYDRRQADAEDAVSDVYLALCRKPPSPRTPSQLHHWLRTVLSNQWATALKRRYAGKELEVVSLDRLTGWTG